MHQTAARRADRQRITSNGVVEVVLTVSVEDPDPVTEVGLNVALAPVVSPLTLKLTALLKPLLAETFIV